LTDSNIIVTDIDSTLVDESYDLTPTAPYLHQFLLHRGYVVFATTKTVDEVLLYIQGWNFPVNRVYIVAEAGGLVAGADLKRYDYTHRGYKILELGVRLTEKDLEIARRSRCSPRGYRDMSLDELEAITGLRGEYAAAARNRLFTESLYSLDRECLLKLGDLYRAMGYFVHIGRRFLTIGRIPGKQAGVRALLTYSARFSTGLYTVYGFGDADMDAGMLEDADYAFLIPSYADVLLRRSDYVKAPLPAPEGWIYLYEKYVVPRILG
jgi:predicted mannosyl-3-phosphoglycerate phosphatase (HAD superfamily)